MASIEETIERLKITDRLIDSIVIDIVRENEKMLIQMNVDNLFAGIDNEGKQIVPPYKPSTIKRKRRKGQPFNRVTTRDEGDHHESIFVKYSDDEFELDAADFKKKYLVRKYGQELYGLTEENLGTLKKIIEERLLEEVRKKILS